MLKNIFATIGVIFTAIKGYEAYEKYKNAVDENEFFKQNYRHSPYPNFDERQAEEDS